MLIVCSGVGSFMSASVLAFLLGLSKRQTRAVDARWAVHVRTAT